MELNAVLLGDSPVENSGGPHQPLGDLSNRQATPPPSKLKSSDSQDDGSMSTTASYVIPEEEMPDPVATLLSEQEKDAFTEKENDVIPSMASVKVAAKAAVNDLSPDVVRRKKKEPKKQPQVQPSTDGFVAEQPATVELAMKDIHEEYDESWNEMMSQLRIQEGKSWNEDPRYVDVFLATLVNPTESQNVKSFREDVSMDQFCGMNPGRSNFAKLVKWAQLKLKEVYLSSRSMKNIIDESRLLLSYDNCIKI